MPPGPPRLALGAAALLLVLVLGSGAAWHASRHYSRGAAGVQEVYVPASVKGAAEARAWLQRYHQGNEERLQAIRMLPAAVSLPSCHPMSAGSPASYLVLACVGDQWGLDSLHNKWLDDPRSADFDVVVVYYGTDPGFSCPACLHVFRDTGPKWPMLYHLLMYNPDWQRLASSAAWKYVWLVDDDIIASSCDITRFLHMTERHQLMMAQMSVCQTEGSQVLWPHLYQRPDNALRYVAFAEVMALALEWSFFRNVIGSTLFASWTGWGLDTLWPYLLHFPRDGVAVVDAVCMTHAGKAGMNSGKNTSIYKVAEASSPFQSPYHEYNRLLQLWHITGKVLSTLGVPVDVRERAKVEFRAMPLTQAAVGTTANQSTAAALNHTLPQLQTSRDAGALVATAAAGPKLRSLVLPGLALLAVLVSVAVGLVLQDRQVQAQLFWQRMAGEKAGP